MNSPGPRVTVGIPVYRGEKHILEAIASVRADTFSDWEILVFDDCSPDSSVELVAKIPDTRIRILSSPTNLGLVNARNKILDDARGEFLAWLDQDDLNYPDRLAKQVAFLDEHPDISLLGSWTDVRVESEDGSIDTFTQVRPLTHGSIRAAMPFINPIACNTVMMRKKHFQQASLSFREEFGNALDYDLWSRASDNLAFHALGQPMGVYRMHSQQTSHGLELQRMNQHALRIQDNFLTRNLHILMSEEERNLHAQLTQLPIQAPDRRILESAKAWYTKLRKANLITQLVDQDAFDLVIGQQWFRVVTSSPELSPPEKIVLGSRGAREIGVAWSRTFRALYAAFVQRHVRR